MQAARASAASLIIVWLVCLGVAVSVALVLGVLNSYYDKTLFEACTSRSKGGGAKGGKEDSQGDAPGHGAKPGAAASRGSTSIFADCSLQVEDQLQNAREVQRYGEYALLLKHSIVSKGV